MRQGGDNPPPCLGLGGLGWGTVPRSGCCAWRQGQIGANAEKSRDDKRLRGKRPLKEVIFLQARYAGGGRGTGDVIKGTLAGGRLLCSGWCRALPAASTGAGIEGLNLQQGRFHLDIKKKFFNSEGSEHQDRPGRL